MPQHWLQPHKNLHFLTMGGLCAFLGTACYGFIIKGRKPSLLLLAYDEDEAGDLLTDQTEMLARQAGIPTFDAREILFSHVPRKYLKDEQGEMMPRWNMDGTPRKNAKGELLSKAEKIDCNDALLADRAAFAENVKRVLAEAGMQ